jgi:hypothetical protein
MCCKLVECRCADSFPEQGIAVASKFIFIFSVLLIQRDVVVVNLAKYRVLIY